MDDPGRLTPEQLRHWMPCAVLLLCLPSELDRQLKRDAGLSYFAYLVMAALSEDPERTQRMSELAVLAGGSLSRLSHTVTGLERRGWVRRSPCPDDGRTTLATLTDAGLATLAAAAPGHAAEVRRLVADVLPPEQLEQLGSAAQAVLEQMLPAGSVRHRR